MAIEDFFENPVYPDPIAILKAELDPVIEPGLTHTAVIQIITRAGALFDVKFEFNMLSGVLKDPKYLKSIQLTRSIYNNTKLNFTLTSIRQEDLPIKTVSAIEGTLPLTGDVTWRDILRTGTVCEAYINDEFKGVFFVQSVTKQASPGMVLWSVSCDSLQEVIRRQTLFFHVGNEPGPYSILPRLGDVLKSNVAFSHVDALQSLIDNFIFSTLQNAGFRFGNSKTFEDYFKVGLAPAGGISPVAYYGPNQILTQGLAPTKDFPVWEVIQRFASAPFHEIWITHGGKNVPLGSGVVAFLPPGAEYIIFRPTPFDDLALSFPGVPLVNGIPVGGELELPLHLVAENAFLAGNVVTDFHVRNTALTRDANNLYSYFSVRLSGLGMDANTSGMAFPPYVDLDNMRFIGKKVFESEFVGLNTSDWLGNTDPRYKIVTTLIKSLQKKAHDWMRFSGEMLKGTITTRYLKKLGEGEWLFYVSDKNIEEQGYYYVPEYDIIMDVEAMDCHMVLHVIRGTPPQGFIRRIPPVPYPAPITALNSIGNTIA